MATLLTFLLAVGCTVSYVQEPSLGAVITGIISMGVSITLLQQEAA